MEDDTIDQATSAVERVIGILEKHTTHSQGTISQMREEILEVQTGNLFIKKQALFKLGEMCHPKWLGDFYIEGLTEEAWSEALNNMYDACARAFDQLEKEGT